MTLPERLFWVGCGMAAVLTASCLLLPWVVLGELQRQADAREPADNVVRLPSGRRG